MIQAPIRFGAPSPAIQWRLRKRLNPAPAPALAVATPDRADDIRLFALTFVAGFLFFTAFLV